MESYTMPSSVGGNIREGIKFNHIAQEVSKVIVGQEETITYILISILCNGHVLLEGIPGVAKTTMIKTITQTVGLSFKRIQFTPDLLPSDLIGTLMYNQKTQDFETKKGPIFANLILADEINRAPAKVQSALLEAMQEHQVTIGSATFPLDDIFIVFATQNPIEQEGTYRLPEAQVDRFMFKLLISYPSLAQEKEVIKRSAAPAPILHHIERDDLLAQQKLVKQIYVDDKIIDYIVALVGATRNPAQHGLQKIASFIQCGASPRASLALYSAAQARAFLCGRDFVIPDDVKYVTYPILRHRISTTYEAHAQHISTDDIIGILLNTIATP